MNRHSQWMVWSSLAVIAVVCASQSPPKSESSSPAPTPDAIHVERVPWLNHDVWFDDQYEHSVRDVSQVKDYTAVRVKAHPNGDAKLDVEINTVRQAVTVHPIEAGFGLFVHFELDANSNLRASLSAKWWSDLGRNHDGDMTDLHGDIYWSIYKDAVNVRVSSVGHKDGSTTPIAAGFVIRTEDAPAFVARLASLPKPSARR